MWTTFFIANHYNRQNEKYKKNTFRFFFIPTSALLYQRTQDLAQYRRNAVQAHELPTLSYQLP